MKKRERNQTHNAIVKQLKRANKAQEEIALQLGARLDNDLIEFMQEYKPDRKPSGDAHLKEFHKALYKLVFHAYLVRQQGDREDWRRVDRLMRDAAVSVVEFESE